ncbi:uncharacterized protein LOC131265879 [Anopheles coustani]|uniref:uncharacterized protein LOC131265879 n=1 Tax=Anopheles coustani TaxID=139045 RepID=UPI0026589348|nr:uncharacterized protein LOC131265879 [Anopheles coustani]
MASFLVQSSVLLLVVLMAFDSTCATGSEQGDFNRGNLVRVARNPQQQPFPNFPQLPFGNPEIVSQDTQNNKNGFTQTTIYKFPNGMGASSVSTSHSGSSKMTGAAWSMVTLIAAVVMKQFY